jgi:hypothetical protein
MSPVLRTIDDVFREAIDEWKEHCQNNAFYRMPGPYLECDAYEQIVAMGSAALPLLRKIYDADISVDPEIERVQAYIIYAVQDIIGKDFSIPDEINGRISAMQGYTLEWLNENMHKYVPKS